MTCPFCGLYAYCKLHDKCLSFGPCRLCETAEDAACPWCGAEDYTVCCLVDDEDVSVGYRGQEYRCDKCMPRLAQ